MLKLSRMAVLLSLAFLPACGLLRPHYEPAPCPAQWSIPAQYKTPSAVQESIQNLQLRLNQLALQLQASQQTVSTSTPTVPPSSALSHDLGKP